MKREAYREIKDGDEVYLNPNIMYKWRVTQAGEWGKDLPEWVKAKVARKEKDKEDEKKGGVDGSWEDDKLRFIFCLFSYSVCST